MIWSHGSSQSFDIKDVVTEYGVTSVLQINPLDNELVATLKSKNIRI